MGYDEAQNYEAAVQGNIDEGGEAMGRSIETPETETVRCRARFATVDTGAAFWVAAECAVTVTRTFPWRMTWAEIVDMLHGLAHDEAAAKLGGLDFELVESDETSMAQGPRP